MVDNLELKALRPLTGSPCRVADYEFNVAMAYHVVNKDGTRDSMLLRAIELYGNAGELTQADRLKSSLHPYTGIPLSNYRRDMQDLPDLMAFDSELLEDISE